MKSFRWSGVYTDFIYRPETNDIVYQYYDTLKKDKNTIEEWINNTGVAHRDIKKNFQKAYKKMLFECELEKILK